MVDRGVLAPLVEPEGGEASAGIVISRDVLEPVADERDRQATPVADRFAPQGDRRPRLVIVGAAFMPTHAEQLEPHESTAARSP